MLLSIRSLTKVFPGTRALDGVDLDLHAGEVHALLGENGAGKSTLIKCLTGAYARDGGTITLEGREVAPRSTLEAQGLGIGTVYQEVNLLENLTVAQNLMFGREPRKWGLVDGRALRRQARAVLGQYGLDIDVDRDLGSYPVAIRQIVAIARAVEISGKVLILDEPTASLDAREVAMVFDVVRGLRARGMAIVFVSHFLDQVFELALRHVAEGAGAVGAGHATGGQFQLALYRAVIGEQQQALGVEVQTTDGHHAPGVFGQGIAQRGVDCWPPRRIAFCGDEASGLVEGEQPRRLGRGDGLAIDCHALEAGQDRRGRFQHLAIERHAPLGNHALHFAAAGDAGAGKQLGNAVAFGAIFGAGGLGGHGAGE